MAKLNRLNSLSIQRAKEPGLHLDGGGLGLQISKSGSKSWVYRYTINKRTRTMGLGALELVSLAEAREVATDCRKQLRDGLDPIDVRINSRQTKAIETLKAFSFDQCAQAYIDSHRPSWRNQKHGDQWTNTIRTYASPIIGNLPIQAIDTTLVMQVLEPIWSTKNETASRIRSRLELVLAWAKVRGYRSGENPALWRNHLDKLLPARSRVQKVKHFAALPFDEISIFMKALKDMDGISPRALEFLILTATRTSETLLACWQEFNLDECLWTIPGERMKAGVEHRVPLSARAIEILKGMREKSEGTFVFPGGRMGRPLSNVALLKVLERMGQEVTGHGFRSTFRDWAVASQVIGPLFVPAIQPPGL